MKGPLHSSDCVAIRDRTHTHDRILKAIARCVSRNTDIKPRVNRTTPADGIPFADSSLQTPIQCALAERSFRPDLRIDGEEWEVKTTTPKPGEDDKKLISRMEAREVEAIAKYNANRHDDPHLVSIALNGRITARTKKSFRLLHAYCNMEGTPRDEWVSNAAAFAVVRSETDKYLRWWDRAACALPTATQHPPHGPPSGPAGGTQDC